jgi:hypothetical protein
MGDDENRYYRCWNCGFRGVDIRRDELGDGRGWEVGEVQEISYDRFLTIESGFNPYVAQGIGNRGIGLMSIITGGCPSCGTKNWK